MLTLNNQTPQEGFEKLFNIMHEEMFDGNVIQLDCLRIVNNLMRNNALTRKVFAQGSCMTHLPKLLALKDANFAMRPPTMAGPPATARHPSLLSVPLPPPPPPQPVTADGSEPTPPPQYVLALSPDHHGCVVQALRIVQQLVTPVLSAPPPPPGPDDPPLTDAQRAKDAEMMAAMDAANAAAADAFRTHLAAQPDVMECVALLAVSARSDVELRPLALNVLTQFVQGHPASQVWCSCSHTLSWRILTPLMHIQARFGDLFLQLEPGQPAKSVLSAVVELAVVSQCVLIPTNPVVALPATVLTLLSPALHAAGTRQPVKQPVV